jgi:hypothetical protein
VRLAVVVLAAGFLLSGVAGQAAGRDPTAAVAKPRYALLGPGYAVGKADRTAAKAIIARARAALSRPPGAVPQLHTEGTLPGKGIREASLVAKRDQPIMLDLAIAWRLTGDR